jgi:hypothetical protein
MIQMTPVMKSVAAVCASSKTMFNALSPEFARPAVQVHRDEPEVHVDRA